MKNSSILLFTFLGWLIIPQALALEDNQTPKKGVTPKTSNTKKPKSNMDWGDWDQKFKPQQRYGVGIKGELQSAISEMDKSNLINDSGGVKVSPTSQSNKKEKAALNIKKMKAELKALEKKVEHEIDDDNDY